MPCSDDIELINRFRHGDKSVFEDIIVRYQDRIFNVCMHMLGNADDAQDAAQETFLKAYRNFVDFKPNASFYTWLYRIAINTCIDHKRKPIWESIFRRNDKDEEIVIEAPSNIYCPEKAYQSKQIITALHIALKKLSPKLRAVIVLREIEGLSYEDISAALDISIGTVKSRISRAREELKTMLIDFMEQK